jgi:lipopolysaccharide/colanic/teichoic acid biosynthesis glycosyltransferase
LKFRSMRNNCESNGAVFATTGDLRVAFENLCVKPASMNSPFLNVLKGDMAIVGPRPERPFFVKFQK